MVDFFPITAVDVGCAGIGSAGPAMDVDGTELHKTSLASLAIRFAAILKGFARTKIEVDIDVRYFILETANRRRGCPLFP